MSRGAPIIGTALALALAVTLFLAPPASAATHRFRVLSASETYSTVASEGCVSGRRDVTESTSGKVPDDPRNSFTPGSGREGIISTRSSTTGISPTTGQTSNDYTNDPCASPPCHHDYGVTPLSGGSITMILTETGDPESLKVSTSIGPPEVGDVTVGICGDIAAVVPEPSTTVSTASLFSGKPVTITISGSLSIPSDILGHPASIVVTYDVTMKVQALGKELQADPGGPYTVRRAARVKLDGSRSKPKSKIVKYLWKFQPEKAACPGDVPGKATRKEGRETSVVALCGLRATLTVVARDGDRDSASTTVDVLPRGPTGWRTPISQREKSGDPRTPHEPPSATSLGGGAYGFSIFGGLNVSDCGAPSESSEILCPLQGGSGSWLGNGYELATVNDPNGPFDGYSYVVAPEIKVKRAALINPTILPGTPFDEHNRQEGRDVAGFLNAIREHEGLGNGTPHSGHSGAIKEVLQTASGDPRRVIEQIFAPDREAAKKRVDGALQGIERRLDRESEDPLAEIWTGTIDFYDSYQQRWITGDGFRIPGRMGG
jgi:hypothetical protein